MSGADALAPSVLLFLAMLAGIACVMAGLYLAMTPRAAAQGTAAGVTAGVTAGGATGAAVRGGGRAVSLRVAEADGRGRLSGLLEPQSLSEMSELRKQLMQAGFTGPNVPRNFALIKLAMVGVGALAGLLLIASVPALAQQQPLMRICVIVSVALLGYFLPTLIVDRRAAAYVDRIALALPDALDLMLVCVEAGQSIDQAILRVARDMEPIHPDLSARFEAATEALKAGADRAEVFARLSYETDNEDLLSFASVVVQSTAMGVPIAETFRVYSADLRDRRVRAVEERANMLPTKMTLGTMMFTIPPLLLLLLTPSVFRILQSF